MGDRVPIEVTTVCQKGSRFLYKIVHKESHLPRKRDMTPTPLAKEKHTFLQVGDKVYHKRYKAWGCGIVVEAWASEVPGGPCYIRIQFQDGKNRVFDNSLDSSCCCFYTGITVLNRIEL